MNPSNEIYKTSPELTYIPRIINNYHQNSNDGKNRLNRHGIAPSLYICLHFKKQDFGLVNFPCLLCLL